MAKVKHSSELSVCIKNAVNQYSGSLIKIAFTYTKNIHDAEDVVQNVYLDYLKKRPTFDSPEHEKAWLIRVAINKSKDYMKTAWFRNRSELPEDLSYMPKEESEIVNAVLSLDKKYRLPIHLYYFEGYSIKEIADILRAKSATIGTRLARGRELLKSMLGGFDGA